MTYYFTSDNGDVSFPVQCRVDEEFVNSRNYQVAPDGDFTLELNSDNSTLDYNLVKKIQVKISGSYIPFQDKKRFISPILY